MTIPNSNMPAFPWHQSPGNQDNLGLTKREWFAGMVGEADIAECLECFESWKDRMQFCQGGDDRIEPIEVVIRSRVKLRAIMADALIAELEKKP